MSRPGDHLCHHDADRVNIHHRHVNLVHLDHPCHHDQDLGNNHHRENLAHHGHPYEDHESRPGDHRIAHDYHAAHPENLESHAHDNLLQIRARHDDHHDV